MLAKRTSLFRSSGTAAARAVARASADAGNDIIDLTAGEIWSDLAPTIRAGASEAISNGINRYTDTAGMMELREALAKKVSVDTGQMWRAEELITTTGAKQALFSAAMVVLNPGDEVIIPTPYWTTFPAQVLIAGGKPVFVETRSNGYVARIEDIEAAVTTRTRAIIVNTPGNPTGAVYDAQTLMAIAQLAIYRDLWVIFDECYGEFVHEHHTHDAIVSLVPEVRPRTLIVNSFSKALALSGWRIGYLAGPKEIIDAVKALQSHTTSNPNVIAQHAVLAHLERGDGSYERQLRSQLTSARQIGLNVLSSLTRVPVPKAQGGFYFYLDLTNLLTRQPWNVITDDAEKIVRSLLTEAGVATVPGTAFGDPAAIRLSYGIPPEKLEAGLSRVVEVLNAWKRPARSRNTEVEYMRCRSKRPKKPSF
ncbi:aminotransferase class I/II-fold pyridoxal phosphate-dependent enzyme [Mesorhizobium sp. 43Arga]